MNPPIFLASQHLQLWAAAGKSLLVPVSCGFSNLCVFQWESLWGNGNVEACISYSRIQL